MLSVSRLNHLIERLNITIVYPSFCTVPSSLYLLVVTGQIVNFIMWNNSDYHPHACKITGIIMDYNELRQMSNWNLVENRSFLPKFYPNFRALKWVQIFCPNFSGSNKLCSIFKYRHTNFWELRYLSENCLR